MLKKARIHGADVNYDDGEPYVSQGINHLMYHLTGDQAKVLFQGAKAGKEAQFEAINNHKFALIFQKRNFDLDIDNFILTSISHI